MSEAEQALYRGLAFIPVLFLFGALFRGILDLLRGSK